jgi:hypothetical protein
MRKIILPLLLSALGIGFSHGQTSETSQPAMDSPAQGAHFAPGTKLRVELDKTIDAKKAKAGDPVVVKTLDAIQSGGEVLAPRGSKIIGHVVAASAHEKGSPSRLEIAFDKFDMQHGSEVPMKATVQALAKPAANPSMAAGDTNPAPSGGATMNPTPRSGMPQGGGGGAGQPGVAPNAGTMGGPSGASGEATPQSGRISLNAEGVEGMPELSLTPGPAQDSVLTSEKHNVKLDGGTQMILRVE